MCPLCGFPKVNSYSCWAVRSGDWTCCSRFPSVLCSLFAGNQYPTSSSFYSFVSISSWKRSVWMHEHHSSTVTRECCLATALHSGHTETGQGIVFSLQKPLWQHAVTKLSSQSLRQLRCCIWHTAGGKAFNQQTAPMCWGHILCCSQGTQADSYNAEDLIHSLRVPDTV